jgi:hypothetical protein
MHVTFATRHSFAPLGPWVFGEACPGPGPRSSVPCPQSSGTAAAVCPTVCCVLCDIAFYVAGVAGAGVAVAVAL